MRNSYRRKRRKNNNHPQSANATAKGFFRALIAAGPGTWYSYFYFLPGKTHRQIESSGKIGAVNKAEPDFVQPRDMSEKLAVKRLCYRAAIGRKALDFPPANDGRLRAGWGKIRHVMPSQRGSASFQEVGNIMMRGLFASAVAMVALALVVDSNVEGAKDKEPLAIKVIMKKAHTAPKGEKSLLQKVTSGKADADEKKELIKLYTDLAANKCPKGDADDWKTRTAAILKAAKDDDGKVLAKAANCKACHDEHK